MSSLAEALGIDPNSPIEQLAERLVEADTTLMRELVRAREQAGLTVEQVAERVGMMPDDVREFEAYWADPKLSVIRRYALAVGVAVTHDVSLA